MISAEKNWLSLAYLAGSSVTLEGGKLTAGVKNEFAFVYNEGRRPLPTDALKNELLLVNRLGVRLTTPGVTTGVKNEFALVYRLGVRLTAPRPTVAA
jgi:hypothetical protein